MSTRSEIRIFNSKGKLKDCIYHHHDGYPEHITKDISALGKGGSPMHFISKSHGTANTKCSSKTAYQGDIEYAYEVHLGQNDYPEKVKIFETKSGKDWSRVKGAMIFEGTPDEAVKKKWD